MFANACLLNHVSSVSLFNLSWCISSISLRNIVLCVGTLGEEASSQWNVNQWQRNSSRNSITKRHVRDIQLMLCWRIPQNMNTKTHLLLFNINNSVDIPEAHTFDFIEYIKLVYMGPHSEQLLSTCNLKSLTNNKLKPPRTIYYFNCRRHDHVNIDRHWPCHSYTAGSVIDS